jgi:uncharacterized surface protein with fasciclin (FAS1) repeats
MGGDGRTTAAGFDRRDRMSGRRIRVIDGSFAVALAFALGTGMAACSDDGSSGASTSTAGGPGTVAPSVTEPEAADGTVTADTTTAPGTVPTESLTYVDEADSVLAVVAARDDTTRFMELAAALGDDAVFRQERGITLLVPVDSAWDAYGDDEFAALLEDPNAVALVLSEHLAIGVFTSADLVAAGEMTNAMARALPVVETAGSITIGGATVVEPDLLADNGVAHLVDAVIQP